MYKKPRKKIKTEKKSEILIGKIQKIHTKKWRIGKLDKQTNSTLLITITCFAIATHCYHKSQKACKTQWYMYSTCRMEYEYNVNGYDYYDYFHLKLI